MSVSEPDEPHPTGPGTGGWGVIVPVAVAVGLGFAGVAVAHEAFDAECRDLPREELSLAEMGQLRRLVDRYKSDPSRPLSLSGRQASFLLREEFEIPMWMDVRGSELSVELRVPQAGRCWNVSYQGDLSVTDAVATLRPRALRVGHLALTPLVDGVALRVEPHQVSLPRAAELLGHTTHLALSADGLDVQVDDPVWLR
jgi:hypothetical protein